MLAQPFELVAHWCEEALSDGEGGGFGAAAGADLAVDIGQVALDGGHADQQLLGHLLVGAAAGHQPQVATGEQGAVRLWEAGSGRELLQLPHDDLVNDVAFSGDGQLLASAGRDGIVRVFSVPGGQEVASMAHTVSANGVAFDPDGSSLATTSDDRTLRVWTLAPGDLLGEACASVTRNLTLEEWQRYLRDQPYRQTCPGLPS